MNYGPFKMIGKGVILVCFTLFVVLPMLVACIWAVQDWRYARFCWRGQQYYARVADACDQLLKLEEPLPCEVRGEKLQSLPAVLSELQPEYATVDTNLVLVRVGRHLIIWRSDTGSSWKLITSDPESRTRDVRFSREKPLSANPTSAVDGGERLRRFIERSGPAATDSNR
jgi:hypothetical protein